MQESHKNSETENKHESKEKFALQEFKKENSPNSSETPKIPKIIKKVSRNHRKSNEISVKTENSDAKISVRKMNYGSYGKPIFRIEKIIQKIQVDNGITYPKIENNINLIRKQKVERYIQKRRLRKQKTIKKVL